MLDKDLLEGMGEVQNFNEEEKQHFAQVFKESAGTPLAYVWERLFKAALKNNYYRLAHLPKMDSGQKIEAIAEIAGRIKELEIMLDMPKLSSEYVEEKKKEEKEDV